MKKVLSALFPAVLLLLSCLPGLAPAREPALADAQNLFNLVNERLSYMKDVAAFKWVNKQPIEDKAREAVVINKSAEAASKSGLEVDSTKDFFRAQIEAAKEIQRGWHDAWRKKGFPAKMKFADLKKDIRPALLKLGNQIIAQVKLALPVLQEVKYQGRLREMVSSHVKVRYVGENTKQELLKALQKIKPAR